MEVEVEWIQILNASIEYIEMHLCDNITVGDVATSVHISSYHFQRTFSMLTGFSVGEYIRNRRLSLAGQDLVNGHKRVIDVALEYGYESPESFSKAFERFHGITPSQAKKQGSSLKSFNRMIIKIVIEGGSVIHYRIERKSAFKLILFPEVFSGESALDEIPHRWQQYIQRSPENRVCPEMGVRLFNQVSNDAFTYGIGCREELVMRIPKDHISFTIPELTWAVFSCEGAMPEAIQKMWRRIYTEWLPQANFTFVDKYDIEYYTEGDIESSIYESEIWIPVVAK